MQGGQEWICEVQGCTFETLAGSQGLEILKALYEGLADGTIRHIKTNALVNVIDEDHAQARWMNTVYYSADARVEDTDRPLPFEGPHRLQDFRADFVRTPEGWRIAHRDSSLIFRRNPGEPVAIEIWAKSGAI